jgi:NAD+ synthase (glutamine-hydrolysing)
MGFKLADFNIIRVAVASPEIRISDVNFNVSQIKKIISESKAKGSHIVLFPELSITGYSCGDLFFNNELQELALDGISEILNYSKEIDEIIIVGFPLLIESKLYNSSAVICKGKILGFPVKTYLPNNNEFYEKRWFNSADDLTTKSVTFLGYEIPIGNNLIFKHENNSKFTFGVEICEDLWAVKPISSDLALQGANLILNLSASNELLGKKEYRKELIRNQSARTNSIYAYASASLWESTTDLVFSGHCLIYENGKLLAESERFSLNNLMIISDCDLDIITNEREKNATFLNKKNLIEPQIIYFTFNETETNQLHRNISQTPFIPKTAQEINAACSEIINMQASALARRLLQIGANKVVIGVSGGVDSTLALLVSYETFKKLNYDIKGIYGISMPGFGTTHRTKNNAQSLCEILKINYLLIPIENSTLQHFKDIDFNENQTTIVYENAQARRRTHILMDYANKINGIVVGTGDLSEIALGWSTYNADHISMYNVNASIPKTLIKTLIKWHAENKFDILAREILYDILDTPISPELLPSNNKDEINQETEKILGPYLLHDFFLYYGIRFGFNIKKLALYAEFAFQDLYDFETIKQTLKTFYKRFFQNQFKRSCFTDGVKIGTVALSPRGDWRMPSDADPSAFLEKIENLKSIIKI